MASRNTQDSGAYAKSLVVAQDQIISAKDKFSSLVAKAGSSHSYEAEARFAMQHIERSPQILKCDPSSVKDSFLNIVAMGLSLNPALGQVAFVPRWNTKKGGLQCTSSPMFRGLIHLAHNSGLIAQLSADIVHVDDKFRCMQGTSPVLEHEPSVFGSSNHNINLLDLDNNDLVAAYCIAWLKTSSIPHITVMYLEDILQIANASEAFNPNEKRRKAGATPSGPWLTWPGQMAIKSVIRRATKQWPMAEAQTSHFANAIQIDTNNEVLEMRTREEEKGTTIDGVSEELINDEQQKTLRQLCRDQDLPVQHVYTNYKIKKMQELPVKLYNEVVKKLQERLRKVTEKRDATP